MSDKTCETCRYEITYVDYDGWHFRCRRCRYNPCLPDRWKPKRWSDLKLEEEK